MDLVNDHGPRGLEHGAAGVRAEQDVEGLRRGHYDMRRKLGRTLAFGWWRVAGAHPRADHDIGQPLCAEHLSDTGERKVEIAVNIVRKRLKRRDIDDLRLVLEFAVESLTHEAIDGAEEGGKRLTGAGWRRDEYIAARGNRRPRVRLCGRRCIEALVEPCSNRGMEEVEWHEKTS